MKYLVTGASGFLGQNFIRLLSKNIEVLSVNSSTKLSVIKEYCSQADFVFHFAAEQRADNYEGFYNGNVKLTETLLNFLTESDNLCPIVFSSSILLDLNPDTDFSKTKRIAEDIILNNHRQTGRKVGVFRLTHTFGPKQKPNHNSVVSTFCFSIVNNQSVSIGNFNTELNLMYISDVLDEINSFVSQEESFLFKSFLGQGYKISVLNLLHLINEVYIGKRADTARGNGFESFRANILKTLQYHAGQRDL